MSGKLMASSTQNQRTVMEIAKPVRPIYKESSLQTAIEALLEGRRGVVPVIHDSRVIGQVEEETLRKGTLDGLPPDSTITPFIANPLTILANQTIDNAIQILRESQKKALIVVDVEGRYIGLLSPFDLRNPIPIGMRPPLVGGVATPFGVLLTSGNVTVGPGPWALMTTGALLVLLGGIGASATLWLIAFLGNQVPYALTNALQLLGPALMFFLLIRLLPISGTHGAEHMVVHAIERREPLTFEAVKRMPRVHPRCGTNIAVGAWMFVLFVSLFWNLFGELGALAALVFTLILWRPVGSFLQATLTTKTPTPSQLEAAIKVGKKLLEQYRFSARVAPSLWRRLAAGGLGWVMIGAVLASTALYLIAKAFGVERLLG